MSKDILITYLLPRPYGWSLPYQRFYFMGLERVATLKIRPLPFPLRVIPTTALKTRALNHLSASKLGSFLLPKTLPQGSQTFCGEYLAEIRTRKIRFAIDGSDMHEVRDPEILGRSEIFFKANKWANREYDSKVRPLVNAGGYLTWKNIRMIKELRHRKRDLDVCFFANIWGGQEHNIRLFEELSKLKCRKELLAVFSPGFDPTEEFLLRLRRLGIPYTRKLVPFPSYWERVSRARIVFRRAGRYLCIPWGMVDHLCMGACMVLDADPYPKWPVPLKSGTHFVDCGIRRPEDTSPARDEDYKNIVPTIELLLDSHNKMEEIREANARYYEEHAAPEQVGKYILNVLGHP